ncbi:MAG: radical SAM protein [Candidatus Aminicenantes bacterium]|nr:radical SAM protein [Candidatus Aminicenantes bacterium]
MFRKPKKKVCLVNLPRRPSTIQEGPCLPLGLLQLAASLQRISCPALILDFDLDVFLDQASSEDDFLKKAVGRIGETGCGIIGISVASATLPLAILLARRLKSRIGDALVILGGPGASAVERAILEAFPEVDVVVRGEGESTLPELIRVWISGGDLASVAGISFRRDGTVVTTSERALIENLDDLPFPLSEPSSFSEYLGHFDREEGYPYLPVEVGRGCPKLCAFCATSRFWGGRARQKSVRRILAEMKKASRLGITGFLLLHDNMGAQPGFLPKLCRNLVRIGTPYRWSCAVSADRIDPEEIALMASSGCTTVLIGIESASPKTQRAIGKRLDLAKADRVIKRCLEAGLQTQVTFIIGFPEEDTEDLALSLDQIFAYHRLGADVRIQPLDLLPGTPLWDRYLPKAVLAPASDRMNPRWIQTREEENLIFDHPEVFSSFRVPCPEDYVSEEVRGASIFYWTLFYSFTQPLCDVLQAVRAVGDGPLEVYRHWNAWRRRNYPDAPITPDLVYASFNDFLDSYSEDFYRRLKTLKPRPSN